MQPVLTSMPAANGAAVPEKLRPEMAITPPFSVMRSGIWMTGYVRRSLSTHCLRNRI